MRSAAAYSERYRGFRDRIDDHVRQMKAASVRPASVRAESVVSNDSSVIGLDPPSDQGDIEYVDMTGLDSSEEET